MIEVQSKGDLMKGRMICAAALLVLISLPMVHAQEFGKIRPLNQRAEHVIKQRNDFVARVLTAYGIAHERNAQGTVVRIHTDGQWQNITAIDIVPLLKEAAGKEQQVASHELLFHTSKGILVLDSELTLR